MCQCLCRKQIPTQPKRQRIKNRDNSQRRRHRRHQHRAARVAEAQLSQSAKARSKLQLLETFLSGTTRRSTARCRCIWLPTSSPSPTLPRRCFPILPSSPAALWPGLSSSQSRPPPSAAPGRLRESGSTPDSCRSQLANPRLARVASGLLDQISVCSEISSASSTSMPGYRTVDFSLEWPSSSTARRFLVSVCARHLDERLSGGHHDVHGNWEGPTALTGTDRHRCCQQC